MRQPNGGVGGIDPLTAGTGGAEDVGAYVLAPQLHVHLIRLWQHGDRSGGGLYPPLRLRHRDTLHAVDAALVLEAAVDLLSLYRKDDRLKAAHCPFVHRRDVAAPALLSAVLLVHLEEIPRKECRLVASRAGADLHDHVAGVVLVLGQQEHPKLLLQLRQLLLDRLQILPRQVGQFGVLSGSDELLVLISLVEERLVLLRLVIDLLEILILQAQLAEEFLIADHLRIGHPDGHLAKLRPQGSQLLR